MKSTNNHLTVFIFLLFGLLLATCKSDPSSSDEPIEGDPEEVVITTTSLPDGEVGIEYNEMLSATGGDGNYSWELESGDLPQGLNLNTSTGAISGLPELDDSFNFTAKVSSAGLTDTKSMSITIAPVVETSTRNAVINVDFMLSLLEQFGDEVYAGDDGILSSENGTFWNPADQVTSVTDASDEFGEPTYVDMAENVNGNISIGAASNELQDNGIVSGGIAEDGIEWQNLVPDSEYELAFYVNHQSNLNLSTVFDVTHAEGVTTLNTNGDTTFTLPGDADKDYLLLQNLKPFEISDGVYGFRIDNINEDGAIMGLQLKGLVPAPES